MRIIENSWLVEQHYDWSKCRSRSRAERRYKQGHKQRVVITSSPMKGGYVIDGVMYVHPSVADTIRREVKQTLGDRMTYAMMGLNMGFLSLNESVSILTETFEDMGSTLRKSGLKMENDVS